MGGFTKAISLGSETTAGEASACELSDEEFEQLELLDVYAPPQAVRTACWPPILEGKHHIYTIYSSSKIGVKQVLGA